MPWSKRWLPCCVSKEQSRSRSGHRQAHRTSPRTTRRKTRAKYAIPEGSAGTLARIPGIADTTGCSISRDRSCYEKVPSVVDSYLSNPCALGAAADYQLETTNSYKVQV